MWATDGATPIGRTLGAGIAALFVAGSAQTAPATPHTITQADVERARQQHRMPTEAELARVPVPGAPRIENLPQPVTHLPVDFEAISKGFESQAGAQAMAMSPRKAGQRVMIFVSFGMPTAALDRLAAQAERLGAILVLRGLVNGSIVDTAARIRTLIGTRKVGVQIDPQAFDRFGIAQTPSFVLVESDDVTGRCARESCSQNLRFAKVAGDVSLAYALRHLTAAVKPDAPVAAPTPTDRRTGP